MKHAASVGWVTALLVLALCGACSGDDDDTGDGGDDAATAGDDDAAVDDDATDDDVSDDDATDDAVDDDAADDDAADDDAAEIDAVDLIDPLIGTGGHGWWAGSVFVGATVPFGMVQFGPDGTGRDGGLAWNHCSGYNYSDDTLLAFSLTHLHGTGIPDLGAVGFMPAAGPMTNKLPTRHSSALLHKTEHAAPGRYEITRDDGVKIELTATQRAGYQRYTPPGGAEALTALVDLHHIAGDGDIGAVSFHLDPAAGTFEGQAHGNGNISKAPAGGLEYYFAGRFDRAPARAGTWDADGLHPGATAATTNRSGLWFEFDTAGGEPVGLQTAVSFVDLDGAKANLAAEPADWNFDGVAAAARQAWAEELAHIRFEGGTPEQRAVMATAIYHALMMPNVYSDADDRYRGLDRAVHAGDGVPYFTNFSLWDTYRVTHSLFNLAWRERQTAMVASLLKMADDGGYLPRWPLADAYTSEMIGTPADVVVAEAHLKRITGFDPDAALDYMLKTALGPVEAGHPFLGRTGVTGYNQYGYVPADAERQSVSLSLEYAVSDFAIANLAAALGRDDEAGLMREHSGNWKNLLDPETLFFRGRNADGTWLPDFEPYKYAGPGLGAFTEGSPAQYQWLVPQDPFGLMQALGGQGATADFLSALFEGAVEEHARVDADHTKEIDWMLKAPAYYWHGNEPDIHTAYMYLQAGRPDLAQRWIRWIADTFYTTATNGLPGNDDAGTMSSWYVFSAMGIYPIAGSDLYLIGAPQFTRVEVAVDDGTLTIEAPAASPDAIYVAGVELNGVPRDVPWFRHRDIAGGGTLRFTMSSEPQQWGVISADTAMPTIPE